MRRAPRTDANHADVREALRKAGWVVVDTSRAGAGFPDLVALKAGRIELIEVKDGTLVPSKRQLSKDEAKLHAACAAAGVAIKVVTSIQEAVNL